LIVPETAVEFRQKGASVSMRPSAQLALNPGARHVRFDNDFTRGTTVAQKEDVMTAPVSSENNSLQNKTVLASGTKSPLFLDDVQFWSPTSILQ